MQHKWAPAGGKIRGIVFFCVGYGETNLWFPRERAVKFVREGFVVHSVDYEGMGRSDGKSSHF
jgi:predicted alpha/beta hydrolase